MIDLLYDGKGQRVAKTVTQSANSNTTQYLIDDMALNGYSQCIAELTNGVVTRSSYIHGHTGPISQIDANGESFYLHDAHGSIRALVDVNGDIIASADYDAYGIPLSGSQPGVAGSRLGYNGEYYDTDLGLIYLRARWYDLSKGRFLTRDPYQGMFEDPMSLQAYLYTHGNPVDFTDPTGNFSIFDLTATQLVSKFGNRANQFRRFSKHSKAAVKAMGALILSLNYAATVESGAANINGGETAQWAALNVSTAVAAPHQLKLAKKLRTNVDKSNKKGDLKATTRRLRSLINYMNKWVSGGKIQGDGIKFGIRNGQTKKQVMPKRNGFPELTPHTRTRVGSVFIKLTGSRSKDDKAADGVSLFKKSSNYTWHHHEVVGVMQAADKDVHKFYHFGGVSVYKLVHGVSKYK